MPGLSSIKTRALRDARPLVAHLELTYKCNWRCVFCYNPRHHDLAPLAPAEWLEVFDDLRALGTLTLCLTGGEPLANPHFFTLATAARERGFALRIFTNGALIRDDATAARIAALLPLSVELSIHGATAAVHDEATARPGSFDDMMAAIARLQQHRVPLLLKSPITRLNEHELDELIALAASLSIPLQIDATITPRDDGDMSPLDFSVSREGLEKVMRIGFATGTMAPQEREAGSVNCGLGRMTVALDPDGNVFPCIQWRHRSLGNVRVTPLREMWQSSAERQEAAATALAANEMLREEGGDLAAIAFCPATAFQRTGDPLVPDAGFIARAAAAAKVRAELAESAERREP